jgi:hypothetical protein
MPELLSPLRRRLCSRSNAVRVAAHLTAVGEHVTVVATPEPLQPWRVVDVGEAASPSLRRLERCA